MSGERCRLSPQAPSLSTLLVGRIFFIDDVLLGSGYQTGVNYDRLRDELGQARELQEVGPPTLRNGPDSSKKDDLLYFSI